MLKRWIIAIFIIVFITTNICADFAQIPANSCPSTPFNQLTQDDIARFLGWVKDTDCCSICGGHYTNSNNIANTPKTQAMQDLPINITSSQHALLTQSGASIIKGNVALIQPGREIFADCVTLFRDNKTGKINYSVLVGNVKFYEYGRLFVAEHSNLNFVDDVHTSINSFYRLLSNTPSGITNIWGRAKHAVRDALGVLKMRRATYSACPPDSTTSWHIWSGKLTINRNTGRGEAMNAFFFIREIPVFYTPYFSFPIDKRRKSGFLYPSIAYSKKSGFSLTTPYYFNLAPNYDVTITPVFFTRRGVLFDGLFNYLTPKNSGKIDVKYIPKDREFTNFRNHAATTNQPDALASLQHSSSNRGFLGLQNNLSMSEHWSGSLIINRVTDDYFLRDFSTAANMINEDQLFNQAELNYADEHWRFSSRVQGFQTLHPLERTEVSDQYRRLPQIDFGGLFPDGFGGLSYQFDSSIVNFTHRDNFYTPHNQVVAGGRFNASSAISLPLNWLGAYVIPKIQLQATGYTLHDQIKSTDPNNITRILPLISVDSGTIFSRDIKLFRNDYTQTLEPRLFYLFIPTTNQDNIPLFDTILPEIDFSQLFRTNRFSGIDRIGDANQIAAAVTIKLLDDSGQEKLNASLGQILSFHKHMVNISDGKTDPLSTEDLSPLVGKLTYAITPKISTNAGAAWDPSNQHIKTSHVDLQYNDSSEKVINLWYDYSFMGDTCLQKPQAPLNRVGVSIGWSVLNNWNILGSVYYNISYKRTETAFYGIEYNSCCWALRLLQSKVYVNTGDVYYATRTYLQIFLKGLGDPKGYTQSVGDQTTDIISSISGYNYNRNIGI